MDIDRITYIFGSFARRRQSPQVGPAKRRSIEQLKPIFHDRSNSTPHQSSKRSVPTSPRALSVIEFNDGAAKLKCPMCRNQFVDPRVLPCLHTFCLKCLEQLETKDFTTWYPDEPEAPDPDASPTSGKTSSGGSGYDSNCKGIRCPTCGAHTDTPFGGPSSFPPNYPLQHQMVLAAINSKATKLLCDLCTEDVMAVARCMDCAVSFCRPCEAIHIRQQSAADHEVLAMDQAREKGITRVSRQIMCMKHPDLELTIFCSTCCQVICRDCILASHPDHIYDPISRAAKTHLTKLRLAVDRAKAVVEESALAANKLNLTSKKIEAQCSRVQGEVEKFVEEYVKAVEEHKMGLLEQIKEVREKKLRSISQEKIRLQRRIRDARDIAYFLDDLLNDGTEVEVLSFLHPVMSKIEQCGNFQQVKELKLSGSIQFLREESVKCPNNFYTLFGILTTQSVSPEHCQINMEDLQNLRVGKRVDVLLETRDQDDSHIERGGELVMAEVRHRDAGASKFITASVHDRKDGTYTISFIPDIAGKSLLSVNVRRLPISGSPFPFTVRSIKPHIGTFHCCTFCSSGGSKEATCGCEGKMPGGYKGCGHGHEGHPGRRHWSCCGNILEHSECVRSNSHYQFTL